MRASLLTTMVLLGLAAITGGCSSSTGNGGTPAPTSCSSLIHAENQDFCKADAIPCTTPRAGSKVEVCGVDIPAPTNDITRTTDTKEFFGSGPPQVSCFNPPYPTAGTSQKVTVSGIAKLFAHGAASTGLAIEFWTVKRTGGANDGVLDQKVGATLTTPADCSTAATGVPVTVTSGGTTTTVYQCKYSYAEVPTDTELVILTQGSGWAKLYDYNIYVPDSEVTAGAWSHDVRALASDDYTTIAQAAIGHGITPGNGAIAGEVHDCGDVRLENATVDIDIQRKLLVYFTPDEDNPLPDQTATATSRLGLYAALDIPVGHVTVAATGRLGGKDVALGFYHAQIYPDAVTAVTFRGLRPYDIAKAK